MNWRVVTLAISLCSCHTSVEDEDPPVLDQPGDSCRSLRVFCLDDQTVRECVDGTWTDRSCEDSCKDLGPAMLSEGCSDAVDEMLDGCVCAPAPGSCAPGSTACESDNELGYCGEGQAWTVYDCDELCASSLATPVSVGCQLDDDGTAACFCIDG